MLTHLFKSKKLRWIILLVLIVLILAKFGFLINLMNYLSVLGNLKYILDLSFILVLVLIIGLSVYYSLEFLIFNLLIINKDLRLPKLLDWIITKSSPNLRKQANSSVNEILKKGYIKNLVLHYIVLVIFLFLFIIFV